MVAVAPEGALPVLAFLTVLVGTAAVVAVPRLPKAYTLAFLAIAVYGMQVLGGYAVTLQLGLMPVAFMEGLQWWAPLTYMYVHSPANWFHIIGNLLILLVAGPALEERLGGGRFLLVYFTAGFAAAAAHLGLASLDLGVVSPASLAIGASGAIFGILTVFAIRHPRETLPFPIFFIIWLPAFVVLLIHLGLNLMYMLQGGGGIAWWGHFAGYLVGLPFAYTLKERAAVEGAPKHLPDVDALRPLATTPELKDTLQKLEQFRKPEFKEDTAFADAWVDRFFNRARCPECGDDLTREGFEARCDRGHYELNFRRNAREKRA